MSNTYIKPYFRLYMHDTSSPSIFSDADIIDLLELHARRLDREPLRQNAEGTIWTSKYGFLDTDYSLFDDYASGAGTVTCTTPSTINYVQGEFNFSEDPDVDVYLDGVTYNIFHACADACVILMGDPARAQSWSRGGIAENPYNLHAIRQTFISMGDETVTHEIKRTYQK